MEIELDAFSGRPNPRWDMADADAVEFASRLRNLAPAQESPAANDALGYRGFVVRPNEGLLDGYEEVRLYRGMAFAKRGNQAEILSDAGRDLERWLLDKARGHVEDAVLSYVRGEIER